MTLFPIILIITVLAIVVFFVKINLGPRPDRRHIDIEDF